MGGHRWLGMVALALSVVAGSAMAQINPFGRGGSVAVTEEDIALQRAAAAAVLGIEPATAGTSERWANPATGHQGEVTLMRIFEHDGLPCRVLRYRIGGGSFTRPAQADIPLCRVADGSWKIVS
jgi:surface antigen